MKNLIKKQNQGKNLFQCISMSVYSSLQVMRNYSHVTWGQGPKFLGNYAESKGPIIRSAKVLENQPEKRDTVPMNLND